MKNFIGGITYKNEFQEVINNIILNYNNLKVLKRIPKEDNFETLVVEGKGEFDARFAFCDLYSNLSNRDSKAFNGKCVYVNFVDYTDDSNEFDKTTGIVICADKKAVRVAMSYDTFDKKDLSEAITYIYTESFADFAEV